MDIDSFFFNQDIKSLIHFSQYRTTYESLNSDFCGMLEGDSFLMGNAYRIRTSAGGCRLEF